MKKNKTPKGEIIKSNVTETYVPITRGAELLGVFEICYDITQHLNDLRKRFSTLLIYLIFFIFLSLIFTVLIRLDRQMLKQKSTTEMLETKQNILLTEQEKQSILFEKIESARKLNTSEYTFNSKLGFISLNTTLNPDQTLAIAYQYTVLGDNTVFVKLNGVSVVYKTFNSLNLLYTTKPDFCKKVETYLQGIISSSNLISQVGEKERNRFFNRLLHSVKEFRERVI